MCEAEMHTCVLTALEGCNAEFARLWVGAQANLFRGEHAMAEVGAARQKAAVMSPVPDGGDAPGRVFVVEALLAPLLDL